MAAHAGDSPHHKESGRHLHILLAEDNAINQLLPYACLRSRIHCHARNNGKERSLPWSERSSMLS